MKRSISSRFSPRTLDAEQLERLSVAREPLLEHLQRTLTGVVVSGQARFDLVIGPRGAGKSHLLGVLEGRLRASPQLEGRAVIVAPPEELHPLSLTHLLALLLRELPADPELGSAEQALRSLQAQHEGEPERRAVDLIRARLGGRALIVLLENLDELFDALGRKGQLRLRNILQTERRWSIVASSRSLVPSFTKYEAPFHGTFNLHRLEPLSPEQCRAMLAALAEAHGQDELARLLRSPRGLARVRGLHHLLGGNPRAMAFLFRQLDEQRLEHFELTLAELADELEPYVQEQMARLSRAQRAIIEVLGESWRPLTVSEISERTFTKQASTSGALRHLRRDALVQARALGRERYYELGDPLHRLARANARPREAIAAFSRVVRWWYAEASEADFSLHHRYALPEVARGGLHAAEAASTLGEAELARHLAQLGSSELLATCEPHRPEMSMALARAWHDQRGPEPPVPRDSLAPLLEVLPSSTPLLAGPLLELLTLTSQLPAESSVHPVFSPLRLDRDGPLASHMLMGLYAWLASRRPLAPLIRLWARLHELCELSWAPAALVDSESPREAVARLSEPERAVVRGLLELHEDREGLVELEL